MGFSTRFWLFGISLLLTATSVNADKLTPTISSQKQAFVGAPVHLRIFKQEAIVELYALKEDKYQLVETYPICNYSGGLGPKQRESDLKSPEGFYQTNVSHLNPNSRFHLSFNIGYPNLFDQSHGYTGNYLMVHGGCISEGCYAIGNNHIEELYYFVNQAIGQGQQTIDIHIFPFKMTEQNMRQHRFSDYYPFWQQLKPAYDYFEKTHNPPLIYTSEGRYFVYPHVLTK